MERVAQSSLIYRIARFIFRQLLSVASLVWLCANLLSALALLLCIAIVKMLLPIKPAQYACDSAIEKLYRWAVAVDSLWLKYIVGLKVELRGKLCGHPAPVVISNHHNGFDIALLQELVSGQSLGRPRRSPPLLKFLIKKELIWLPIVGWVCFLLDFPRLGRTTVNNGRQKDYKTVRQASRQHGIERNRHSGALLIFPEGTRYTQAKQRQQQSPYRYLLKPKSGGLSIIQQNVPADTPLLDITIDYGQRRRSAAATLWSCLHGCPETIVVHIEQFNLSEISDIECWLNQRWHEKDSLLAGPR